MNTFQLFVCLGVGAAFVSAQEPERVKARVQAVSLEAEALSGIFWHDGQEYLPLRVPASYLPEAVAVEGPNPMPLFVEARGPEGETLYRPAGAVGLPPEGGAVILLLRRRGDEVLGQAVPLETGRFPDGSYMIFNLSREMLFLSMEEQVSRIAGGGVAVVRPASASPAPIPVMFRRDDQQEDLDIVTTTWFYNPRARHLVFFFRMDGREQIRSLLLPFRE